MAKRALIVDDSKTARAFLARMLEKHGIEADSAESAEDALDYLSSRRPDVIFMDHQMSGMDGLQAVKLIKTEPRTATIPIMMYTSQEGELYLGQARALGAMGVLPKQFVHADVSKVLYQLHLLPERRRADPGSVDVMADEPRGRGAFRLPDDQPLTDGALREQLADLRRAVISAGDDQADRIMAQAQQQAGPGHGRLHALAWAVAAGACVAAVALAVLLWRQSTQQRLLADEIAQLRAMQPPVVAQVPADVAQGGQSQMPPAPSSPATGSAPGLAAPRPLVLPVAYGEDPFSPPRLDVLRQQLDQLVAQGFHGVVEIHSYSGRFCLAGSAAEGYSVAPDDLPYSKCDAVAAAADATRLAGRPPVGLADLMASFAAATHGVAQVQLVSGRGRAVEDSVAYPSVSDTLLAGEWNRAASANNRIEILPRGG